MDAKGAGPAPLPPAPLAPPPTVRVPPPAVRTFFAAITTLNKCSLPSLAPGPLFFVLPPAPARGRRAASEEE